MNARHRPMDFPDRPFTEEDRPAVESDAIKTLKDVIEARMKEGMTFTMARNYQIKILGVSDAVAERNYDILFFTERQKTWARIKLEIGKKYLEEHTHLEEYQ